MFTHMHPTLSFRGSSARGNLVLQTIHLSSVLLLTLLLTLVLTSVAQAKGSFAFIAISGEGLNGEIRTADRNLTLDWFAFADFPGGGIDAPASPPAGGYVITRYYIDGRKPSAFDQLHYYPAAGLVYYDGLKGGSSEYDGKWYTANPVIAGAFRSALMREIGLHSTVIRKS